MHATLVALLVAAASQAGATVPKTFRVDYFHTGNAQEERFTLDRLVVEPLPWPGNPDAPTDDTNLGKYFFEVRERATNQLLYSRGFASIYGEWETTAEAKQANRTFHESLRFPTARRARAGGAEEARPAERLPRVVVPGGGSQGHVRGPLQARLARAAHQAARDGGSAEEGGLPHPRRRLHRRRARQVREGRAQAGGDPLLLLALQGAQGGLQRVGPVPAVGRVRHLPAVARHPPPLAGGRHLRRLRLRALHPHLRQPRLPRRGLVRARTSSWRSWSTARPTAGAASTTSTARWPPTASGRPTSSSTSSATTSPRSRTSTTPPSPTTSRTPSAPSPGSPTSPRSMIRRA